MRFVASRVGSLAVVLWLAACTGEMTATLPVVAQPAVRPLLMDTDRDNRLDALDLNGDRVPDLRLRAAAIECPSPLLDRDGDGLIDGLDTDCDGDADLEICETPLVDVDGDGVLDGVDLDCDGGVEVPPSDDDAPDWCLATPTDTNGDGIPESIDVDCDGDAEMGWDGAGWGWGAGHGDGDGSHDQDHGGCRPDCLDTDGDGWDDQFDWNCDRQGDQSMDGCRGVPDGQGGQAFHCEGEPVDTCFPEPMDWDEDGFWDGVDSNCDGALDYSC